jgi:hypothetical protein
MILVGMRRYLFALAAIVFIVPAPCISEYSAAQQSSSNGNAENHQSQSEPEITTLRVTTREVLVDLIALDRRNQPVLDLKPAELQVSETPELERNEKRKQRMHRSAASVAVEPIGSFSIVDPTKSPSIDAAGTGVRIATSCLERSTVHYLLAFHPGPDGWTSGHHRIAITTRRSHIKLFYRHEYYVGLSAPLPDAPIQTKENIDQVMRQSACYYPVTPLSFTLQARLVDAGRTDVSVTSFLSTPVLFPFSHSGVIRQTEVLRGSTAASTSIMQSAISTKADIPSAITMLRLSKSLRPPIMLAPWIADFRISWSFPRQAKLP